ncbi:MAG: hypothetical protein H8E34_10455 [Bacteroidetes bacterium]|nr:hypothetical protein [Bacteroidota bacterium]
MANYTDSVQAAANYKLKEMMLKPEFKVKPSAALGIFLKNTEFLVPASEREAQWNQKPSDSTTVTVKTLNKQSTTNASARAAAHTGSINDSSTANASYTIYAQKFKYSIKEADKDIFSLGEHIAAQYRSAFIDWHERVETALVASLDTNKSQAVVSTSPASGSWDSTNYLFGVAAANEDYYFQHLQMFMKEQYYSGQFDVLNSIGAAIKMAQITNQGAGNATNLQWQDMGLTPHTSTGITLDSGYQYQSFMIPQGTIGILPWIPKLNRQGFGNIFSNGGMYSTMLDPLGSGLTFAVHQYATAADNATPAETQDIDIQVEISCDLAPFYAPETTSNANPVFLCGLLT